MRSRPANNRLFLGPSYQSDADLVFATADGHPLSGRNVYRQYQRVIRSSGIPNVTWHSLRHTHATLLLSQGAPVAFVSERLGHANPSVTYSIYTHVVDGMQDAYVRKIGAWMRPKQKGRSDSTARIRWQFGLSEV